MFGKIFDSIYDGTLAEDWRALVTFQQMIVLCDADGMIDMTPIAMSKRTGIPIEHIKAGIEILEKEDKYSRTPDEDGKRIELIDDHRPWGWHIVNHEKYKNTSDADTIRAQTRERVRRHRENKRNDKVTHVTPSNDQKRHIDTDINTNTLKTTPENKFSDFDYKMASYMGRKLLEIIPKMKTPNFEKWANEIRLMRDRDNRTEKEIKTVFDWANNDSFWKTNILSPAKLRKQFDRLSLNVNEGLNNGSGQGKGTNNNNKSEQVSNKLDEIAKRDIDENGFTSELGGSDT